MITYTLHSYRINTKILTTEYLRQHFSLQVPHWKHGAVQVAAVTPEQSTTTIQLSPMAKTAKAKNVVKITVFMFDNVGESEMLGPR